MITNAVAPGTDPLFDAVVELIPRMWAEQPADRPSCRDVLDILEPFYQDRGLPKLRHGVVGGGSTSNVPVSDQAAGADAAPGGINSAATGSLDPKSVEV